MLSKKLAVINSLQAGNGDSLILRVKVSLQLDEMKVWKAWL